jgi:hypothetical protein
LVSAFDLTFELGDLSVALLPFWVSPAKAVAPAAKKSSRQRYNVASATPQRRAITAAGNDQKTGASFDHRAGAIRAIVDRSASFRVARL